MSGLLDSAAHLASPWAYVVVGALAALEASAFVGLFIPGETVVLLGGVLASHGRVNLGAMMAAAGTGAVVGDSVGYEIGRHFGDRLRRSRLGRRVGDARWERGSAYLGRKGGRAIFFGRFVGVLRALVPALAGVARMPYRTFLAWNMAGGIVWSCAFVALGYAAGDSYRRVERYAGRAGLLLLVVGVLIGGVFLVARWLADHPAEVQAFARRQLERPVVGRFRARYRRQLAFLARRLHPEGALGLSLTLSLVADSYLCIPLIAQGRSIGVLHLAVPAPAGAISAGFDDSVQTVAATFMENLALALTNFRLREMLLVQSIRDPLTGLYNRRYMEEALQRELKRAERKHRPLGLLMIDVDHFKNWNDTFGHEAGDAVIREVARLLERHTRAEDIASRYGGDEFLLVFPEASAETTWRRAQELLAASHELEVRHHGRVLDNVTVTIGVAAYPDNGDEPAALIRAADAALYAGKRGGRNTVEPSADLDLTESRQTGRGTGPPRPSEAHRAAGAVRSERADPTTFSGQASP